MAANMFSNEQIDFNFNNEMTFDEFKIRLKEKKNRLIIESSANNLYHL